MQCTYTDVYYYIVLEKSTDQAPYQLDTYPVNGPFYSCMLSTASYEKELNLVALF